MTKIQKMVRMGLGIAAAGTLFQLGSCDLANLGSSITGLFGSLLG